MGRLSAQTTAAPATAKPAADQETIQLSPFVVEATEDQGYTAKDTLAGTRVRTDLKDVASAISVVTAQFLKDTGAKNSSDLLVYTPSTEVGGIRGNFSGASGTQVYSEKTISNTTRVRGLDTADNTRDYFLTDIPWDGFNVGRVDLQRGPNSILFGIGSPAGIINTSVNDASFKTAYNFENRIDQYGSNRNSLNLNQELIKGVLAIRVALLKDDELYEQVPAYNNTDRKYVAVRFDPKLFGSDNHTSIRAKYEDGKIDSNNPRNLPPLDSITRWFKTSADAYGNPGYNKLIVNQYDNLGHGKASTYAQNYGFMNAVRTYWPDVMNYYEATQLPNTSGTVPSSTPLKTITNGVNIGLSPKNQINGANPSFLPVAVPSTAFFSTQANLFHNVPGGAYYANTTLSDPSIFNFYKNLADGANKHEWQKWHALNVVLEQSFFHDRLAIQVAFDHQDYLQGIEGFMTGENYNLNVDINATLTDGSVNPNAGRPYFGNGASAPGLNYTDLTIRDTVRITPTYEFHPEDYLGNTALAKAIGKQVFTALYDRTNVRDDNIGFARYAVDGSFVASNSSTNQPGNTLNQNRSFEWTAYVGPNMLNRTSAAGLNASRINQVIAPPPQQSTLNFNSTWNKSAIPTAPNYVDPTAPYTYINQATGASTVGTQIDNPANYVGWTNQQIKWLSSDNPADYPGLVTNATRNRLRNTSQAFTWQGYFLGGDLVPTVGWRKDVTTSYSSIAPTDTPSGFTSLNYPDNMASRRDNRGESKSWGVVYHLPKSIMSKLPGNSTLSLFYDAGRNFRADATRLDLNSNPIPNATGQTTEYGFTVTTLNEKLSLKVDWFKTKVVGATLAGTDGNSIGGLGGNGYVIANEGMWGYGWATMLQQGLRGDPNIAQGNWDYANADGLPHGTAAEIAAYDLYNHKGGTFTDGTGKTHVSIGGDAIVNAWLNAPYSANFFLAYGQNPAVNPSIGHASGSLKDSYYNGNSPGINNGNNIGGGSVFGNHQTTVDNLSKGTEVELNYQPVKNWNLTLNYTRVDATHDNIDPVSKAFIGQMTAFMNGPGGQIRAWGNGDGNQIKDNWNNSIAFPYTVQLNQQGKEAPEVSPWRLNMVTSYSFDHGTVKGLFVGGGLRVEAGRIIGYKYDPTFKNSNASDPNYAAIPGITTGGLNVDQVFRGQNDTHLDFWVGYKRKITSRIDWRIQLNIRSVGEKDKLVASRINPDGSLALARIQQGAGYQLTNSFDF
ncbi:MAG: TonB-dependent receptor plug domain-containing protein [Lacunisphaera sp.]